MSRPAALTVVIAATDSAAAVARCLGSLGPPPEVEVEVIVVAARDRIDPREATPGVRWIPAPRGSGVPRLRRLGLGRARGAVVAFTEDSCLLAPGWAGAWLRAFRDPGVCAATGPVDPAEGRSAVDWAVFFCEYAPFLGPPRPGRPARLAGNNFALRADAARALGGPRELHESELHRGLARTGGGLRSVAAARARHVRRFDLRQALRDRLRGGIEFGRLRAARVPPAPRPLVLLAGPAILPAQVARLARAMASARRRGGPFLAALPITLALLTAWSVGEWLGWLAGPPPPRPRASP